MKLPNILYILTFRAKNNYRKKNIKIVIQWLEIVKTYLFLNYNLILDICIIEQDANPWELLPKNNINYIFLKNEKVFNKGWSFNVAVTKFPNYDYYFFADSDIIIPSIDVLCDGIVEHTIISPKFAFRPFKNRLDTTNINCIGINTFDEIMNLLPSIKDTLNDHKGLSFASNIICINAEIFEKIGGWDEIFTGWGRFDDFLGHKLKIIANCPEVYLDISGIHLWHPINIDYCLASSCDNIHYYDTYIKYNKDQLIELIQNISKNNGNDQLYI